MFLCQIFRVYRQRNKLRRLIENYRLAREGYETESCFDRCRRWWRACFGEKGRYYKEEEYEPEQKEGFFAKVKDRQTVHHEVAKRVICFFAMMVFFVLLYFLIMLKWAISPTDAGIACGAAGIVSACLIVLSDTFCCLFGIVLVRMMTDVGRTIVVLLALSYTIQGPMMLVQENLRQTTKTLTCIQEEVHREAIKAKNYAHSVLRSKLKPFEVMAKRFRDTCARVQEVLKNMYAGVTILARGLKKLGSWLSSIIHICNTELEKPYDRCKIWFQSLIDRCDDSVKYFPVIWAYCRAFSLFKHFCAFALLLTKLCDWGQNVVDRIKEAIIDRITNQIEQVQSQISQAYAFNFTVKENFTYDLAFKTNIHELYDIMADSLATFKSWIATFDNVIELAIVFTLLRMVFKAVIYRARFLKSDRYDNYYVTSRFAAYDRNQFLHGREALLPLTPQERRKYIYRTSLRITKSEFFTRMLPNMLNLIVSSVIVIYWFSMSFIINKFLLNVDSHLKTATGFEFPLTYQMDVAGEGEIAAAYEQMMKSLAPEVATPQQIASYWVRCVHLPTEEDPIVQFTVATLLTYGFVSVVLQVYVDRSRSVICSYFYPKRVLPRLAHLHMTIAADRGTWQQFAAKMFEQKITGQQDIGMKIMRRIKTRIPMVGMLMRAAGVQTKTCYECNKQGPMIDFENFRQCENPRCAATYCLGCFFRSEQCLKCKQVKQPPDLDIDEEKPSRKLTSKERKKLAKRKKLEEDIIQLYEAKI